MTFYKGMIPWNKGKKCGYLLGNKHAKGQKVGFKHSEKTKEFLSELHKENWKQGKEKVNSGNFKKGFIPWNKGKKTELIPWNYIDGRSNNASPARYGDDWFKIRLLIYRRDNFTCQECGLKMSKETGPFHIHHKIPFLISFDNSPKNLITLCPSCHRRIEAKIMRQLKNQKVEV